MTITDLGEVLPSIQMNVDANKTEGHELDVKVAFLFLHPCSDRLAELTGRWLSCGGAKILATWYEMGRLTSS